MRFRGGSTAVGVDRLLGSALLLTSLQPKRRARAQHHVPLRFAGATEVAPEARAPDVVMFTRPGCPFCNRAKALLTDRGVDFGLVDVSAEPNRRAEAMQLSGSSTVPQIFVGHRRVGGFDDLAEHDRKGVLRQVLERKEADGESIPPTPTAAVNALLALTEEVRAPLLRRAVDVEAMQCSPGSSPSLLSFVRYAVTRKPLQKQTANVPLNSSAAPGSSPMPPALPDASAGQLAALLRTMMLQLIDKFVDVSTGAVDYAHMKAAHDWGAFRALACELSHPRLQQELLDLTECDRKALLINLYNAMTFHGIVAYGRRPGWWYLYCFFITPIVSYSLAGVAISLDDIENGMLRLLPGYFMAEDQEFQRRMRVGRLDERIHMALNCGAQGCPAVGVYSGPTLDAELDEAAATFVADNKNVKVQTSDDGGIHVALSELFKMYISDFAGWDADANEASGHIGVVRWVLRHARGEKQELLVAALACSATSPQHFKFEWLPYDWSTNGIDMPLDSRVYTPTLL